MWTKFYYIGQSWHTWRSVFWGIVYYASTQYQMLREKMCKDQVCNRKSFCDSESQYTAQSEQCKLGGAGLCKHGPFPSLLVGPGKLLAGMKATWASLKMWSVNGLLTLTTVNTLMHRAGHNCWAVLHNCIGQYIMLHLPETVGFNFFYRTEEAVIISLFYKYVFGLCTLLLLTEESVWLNYN